MKIKTTLPANKVPVTKRRTRFDYVVRKVGELQPDTALQLEMDYKSQSFLLRNHVLKAFPSMKFKFTNILEEDKQMLYITREG